MTNAEIADLWRATVTSDATWVRSTNQSGAGTGVLNGYVVEAFSLQRRAYLKPGGRLSDAERAKCFAAREKIASDLAHDLALPVPPAVLFRPRDSWDDSEPLAVVSLLVFPFQLEWAYVALEGLRPPSISDAEVAQVLGVGARLVAFDTWLDEYDHSDAQPGNIVWGYDPKDGASSLSFLDYASSMGADSSWTGGGWRHVEIAPFPRKLLDSLDRSALEQTVDAVEAFPERSIIDIVERIPADFLPDDAKDVVKAGLIERRAPVARVLRERLLAQGRGQ